MPNLKGLNFALEPVRTNPLVAQPIVAKQKPVTPDDGAAGEAPKAAAPVAAPAPAGGAPAIGAPPQAMGAAQAAVPPKAAMQLPPAQTPVVAPSMPGLKVNLPESTPGDEITGPKQGVPEELGGLRGDAARDRNTEMRVTSGAVGRPSFDRNAANVARPSDFVGFDTFGGLNAEAMNRLADKAAAATFGLRNEAGAKLRAAEAEARASGKPLEQTASFAEYRALKAKADEAGGSKLDENGQSYAGNLAPTGNPYEDSLRAAYATGQRNREAGDQGTLNQAGSDAAHWLGAERTAATEAAGFDAKAKTDAEAAAKARDEANASAREKEAGFNAYLTSVRGLGNDTVKYDKLGANEEAIMRKAFESGLSPEEAARQLTSLIALRGK